MASPAAQSGAFKASAPLTWPAAYCDILLVGAVLSAITLIVAVLGIWFRRARGRWRLIQKTQRSEGVYWVPNVPVLSAICIIIFCMLNLVWCPFLYLLYHTGSTPSFSVIRVFTLCLPFPLFAWAHFSSFGPVYACHLFPLSTVEAARPRLARWLRFKPGVVNALCYSIPLIAILPTLGVALGWAIETASNDQLSLNANTTSGTATIAAAQQWIIQNRQLVQQYGAQWSMWSVFFAVAGIVNALYSSLLLPTLAREISSLKEMDRIARSFDTAHSTSRSNVTTREWPEGKAPTGLGIEGPSTQTDTRPEPPPKRPSWISLGRLSSLQSYTDSAGRKLTKFQLLQQNSRIAAWELVLFLSFTVLWTALSLFKAIEAKQVLTSGNSLASTLTAELALGLGFGLSVCALICRRGYNTARALRSPEFVPSYQSPNLVFLSNAAGEFAIALDAEKDDHFTSLESDDRAELAVLPIANSTPPEIQVNPYMGRRVSLVRFDLDEETKLSTFAEPTT